MAEAGAYPRIDEPEADSIPAGLEVIDAHVHVFPPRVFAAVWRWFDRHAWPIRYRLTSEEVIEFLTARGVSALVALQYAHAPGMARSLNAYAAELGRRFPQVVPLATVLPGEAGAREILREAFFDLGLRGVKLHSHVQRFAADDAVARPIYEECEAAGLPVVIHAGREPAFAGYAVDPRRLCGAERVAHVIERHPGLTLVVPHMGADEFDAYAALLERTPGLYLDTTMWFAGYFESTAPLALLERFAGRILYGSDFPNVPYAWDRELRRLAAAPLAAAAREALFSGAARAVFRIP